MQWWPAFSCLQSNLMSRTSLLNGKTGCCPGLMLFYSCVILWSYPPVNLVTTTLWCNWSPAFNSLFPFFCVYILSTIMANCSNISAYARSMFLPCTPAISWLLLFLFLFPIFLLCSSFQLYVCCLTPVQGTHSVRHNQPTAYFFCLLSLVSYSV